MLCHYQNQSYRYTPSYGRHRKFLCPIAFRPCPGDRQTRKMFKLSLPHWPYRFHTKQSSTSLNVCHVCTIKSEPLLYPCMVNGLPLHLLTIDFFIQESATKDVVLHNYRCSYYATFCRQSDCFRSATSRRKWQDYRYVHLLKNECYFLFWIFKCFAKTSFDLQSKLRISACGLQNNLLNSSNIKFQAIVTWQ